MSEDNADFDCKSNVLAVRAATGWEQVRGRETGQTPGAGLVMPQGGAATITTAAYPDDRQDDDDDNDVSGIAQDDDDVTDADPKDDNDDDDDDDDDEDDALNDLGDKTGAQVSGQATPPAEASPR